MRFVVLLLSAVFVLGCDREANWQSVTRQNDAGNSSSNSDNAHIRVLLAEQDEIDISCEVVGNSRGSFFNIRKAGTNNKLRQLTVNRRYSLRLNHGRWFVTRQDIKTIGITDSAFVINADQIETEIYPNGIISLWLQGSKKVRYRGSIRLVPTGPKRFEIINVVDVEDYLLGVVGAEMYSHWHKSALRAQCIASRTYALYQVYMRKVDGLSSGNKKFWDLRNTQASQVYAGLAAENQRITQAVRETAGIVLAYGPKGREKIFSTYYSAICGGHTQDAANVFGQDIGPLSGRPCDYCKKIAPREKYNWPSVTINKESLSKLLISRYPKFAELEKIVGVKIAGKSNYGRAERIELTGSNQKRAYLPAKDFRLVVYRAGKKLLSSWYRMVDLGRTVRFENGRGWGHGVGLCQWGTQQMAKEGKSSVEILEYYYPGAELVRGY